MALNSSKRSLTNMLDLLFVFLLIAIGESLNGRTPQLKRLPKTVALSPSTLDSALISQAVKDDSIQVQSEINKIEADSTMEQQNHVPFDKKTIVIGSFAAGMASVSALARFGILNGPLDVATNEYGVYTNAMIGQDIGLSILTAFLGYVLVKVISIGYKNDLYGSKVSRKLSHTLSAPLFMIFYPFFSAADGSRFFAGLVIMTNIIRLYLAGIGLDNSLADSVSRSGDKSEALGGPFIYVCLFEVFTLLFWRTSPIGAVAMSNMAAGDGMADLVGRKFGRNNKWWFSEDKSVAGTVAFAIASALTSYAIVQLFVATGYVQSTMLPMELFTRVSVISVICSLIELLPIGDDNYNVPLSAAVLTGLLLQ